MQTQQMAAQDSASKIAVVVSPALFVPVSVAVQAGVQVRLSRRWQLVTEAAYPTFYPRNTPYQRIRYWRAGSELQYAFRRKPALQNYLSLQVAYLVRNFRQAGQALYYTPTQTFTYSNADIHSPVLSTAIKTGVQLAAGNRFLVDLFGGAGGRFIFTSYTTKSALVTSISPKRQTFVSSDDAWLYNYTLKRLHVVVGFRLGLRL